MQILLAIILYFFIENKCKAEKYLQQWVRSFFYCWFSAVLSASICLGAAENIDGLCYCKSGIFLYLFQLEGRVSKEYYHTSLIITVHLVSYQHGRDCQYSAGASICYRQGKVQQDHAAVSSSFPPNAVIVSCSDIY